MKYYRGESAAHAASDDADWKHTGGITDSNGHAQLLTLSSHAVTRRIRERDDE